MNREELIEELKELKEVYHYCDCGYVNIDEDYGEVIERVIQLIQPTPLTEEVERALFEIGEIEFENITSFYEDTGELKSISSTKQYHTIKSHIMQQAQRIKELELKLQEYEEVLNSDEPMSVRLAKLKQLSEEE